MHDRSCFCHIGKLARIFSMIIAGITMHNHRNIRIFKCNKKIYSVLAAQIGKFWGIVLQFSQTFRLNLSVYLYLESIPSSTLMPSIEFMPPDILPAVNYPPWNCHLPDICHLEPIHL